MTEIWSRFRCVNVQASNVCVSCIVAIVKILVCTGGGGAGGIITGGSAVGGFRTGGRCLGVPTGVITCLNSTSVESHLCLLLLSSACFRTRYHTSFSIGVPLL